MMSYLLAFITFVCSHAQCDPSAIGYNRNALTYWIQQYASQTVNESNRLLKENQQNQESQQQNQ